MEYQTEGQDNQAKENGLLPLERARDPMIGRPSNGPVCSRASCGQQPVARAVGAVIVSEQKVAIKLIDLPGQRPRRRRSGC